MTTVSFAQYAPTFGDRDANFRRIEALAAEAAAGGAQLIVLPELGATGYDFHDRAEVAQFAEPFGEGPTPHLARDLAARHNMTVVIGYPELADASRFHNSCLLATPDGQLANYRKLHLFSRETELFEPGDAPPPVIDTPAGRVGLMICFDWFFPEVARVLALAGAQIIAHPSNLVLQHCQRAMYARSVENGVFTITANRIGTEDRAGRALTFTGASQILDTRGQTLTSAPPDAEAVGFATIDPAAADNKQITSHNHLLQSRRPEFYAPLTN